MLAWLRLDIVRLFVLAIPALVVFLLLLDSAGSWAAAAVLLATTVGAWAFWQLDERPIALGPSFLVFFLAYCLLFSFAAGSQLLSGPQVLLASYEQAVPRNFLALDRWGDWHYRWAPDAPPADDLVVVTLPSFAGKLREDARRNFAFLIRKAVDAGARGIAFDYFLAQESASDRLLVQMLDQAEARGLPVVFGYRHARRDGRIFRPRSTPSLAAALPFTRLGHLAGYREADGRVRMVPIDLPGNRGLPSLSWRIASLLGEGVHGPSRGLLQFLEPAGGIRVEPFSPDIDADQLRDRFLIVGTAADSDRVDTPFGERQGVVVHAYAAHGLRTGHFIRRIDRRTTFPLIFLLCYLLAVREARGVPRRKLLRTALYLSALVVVTAAAAMRFALLWIDLAYPLVAIWGLTTLLIAGRFVRQWWQARRHVRALRAGTPSRASAEPRVRTGDFDVFLSHNGRDKDDVRPVARAIEERGLTPWLDEEQLVPGRPWQEGLEEILRTVRSSAVFVGKSGLGPWEIPEMRASLSECVRRGMPVIPVLLPGAGDQPVLPLFLTQYTWVDLRAGLSEPALDRLEWGITGTKVTRKREFP